MKVKKSLVLAAAVAAVVAAPGAFATNGYLGHGIGTNAKAMGGVGIAFPQDAMAAATNPAGQVLVGKKLSIGVDRFAPFRSATRVNNTDGSYLASSANEFYIPEFGYATPYGSNSSLGIVVYGAGLGTDYEKPWSVTGGSTNLLMTLTQMTIAPTWATKMGNHSFGASLNIVKETLDMRGLQGFSSFTPSGTTNYLTDQGEDSALGVGIKLGWIGELTPNFTMGATIQPQTSMSKFGKYKELLAEQGKADVPLQYGLGFAFKASPATVVGFDVVKIKWNSVKSFGNTANATVSTGSHQLGNNDGLGFGWQDQTVYKLGVSHNFGKWTLRAGYNYGKSPVINTETLFGTLAPAVTEKHYTLGASWAASSSTDISLQYMYSPSNEVKGSGSNTASTMANPDLKMNQNSIGIALNVKM